MSVQKFLSLAGITREDMRIREPRVVTVLLETTEAEEARRRYLKKKVASLV
jgi:hypothetical protein